MKNVITSFIIALLTCLCGLGANYYWFTKNHWLMLGFKMHGGEITVENGFGLIVSHIYAMRPEDMDSINIRFNIVMFIIWLLAIWAVIFLVVLIMQKLIRK